MAGAKISPFFPSTAPLDPLDAKLAGDGNSEAVTQKLGIVGFGYSKIHHEARK